MFNISCFFTTCVAPHKACEARNKIIKCAINRAHLNNKFQVSDKVSIFDTRLVFAKLEEKFQFLFPLVLKQLELPTQNE